MKNVGTLLGVIRNTDESHDYNANPYLQEALQFSDILFGINELEKNNFNMFVDNSKPIIVEVGSYFGKNLIQMAINHPEFNFFGLEITYKRSVKCARKIKQNNLTNVCVGVCDARDFFKAITPNRVAGICVFFPDPWPRRKHEKNRLLQKEFIEVIKSKLVANGFLWLKTDQEFYFSFSKNNFLEQSWVMSDLNAQPKELADEAYVTVFEELFIKQGNSPCRAVFRTNNFG